MLTINKVRQAVDENRFAFGVYVYTPSPDIVTMLGLAGFDYIRIDMDGSGKNIETVQQMIMAAYAVGVTPFVRIPSPMNVDEVHRILRMGALGIIVPRVTSVDDVRSAVNAVKGPPEGERAVAPGGLTGGYGQISRADHEQWARSNILLSVQIETKSAADAINDIVAVPGLDMVQSGRNDLSYDLGLSGQSDHPTVLAIEEKVVRAGIDAGKIVSVQHYPLQGGDQLDRVRRYMDLGVQCLNLGKDDDVIFAWRNVLAQLKDK